MRKGVVPGGQRGRPCHGRRKSSRFHRHEAVDARAETSDPPSTAWRHGGGLGVSASSAPRSTRRELSPAAAAAGPGGSARRRRLGYVLKRFPRISETFIPAELIQLERGG